MSFDTKQARADLGRLVQAARNRAPSRRHDKMFSVIADMNSTLDPNKLFPAAVRKVVRIFQAERGFLILGRGPGSLRFQTAATFDGHVIDQPEEEVSHAVIREVAADRKPVVVPNALEDERFAGVSSVLKLELLSVMCAPLVAEGELLGVVYLDNRALSGVFGETDLDLLSLFANHAAIAIRNAQLFEELRQTKLALLQAERLKAAAEACMDVAHEMKVRLTPMALMASQVAERRNDPDFLDAFTEIFDEESGRLNGMVQDLLKYGRPSPLVMAGMDLRDVLDAAVSLFQTAMADAGGTFAREYDPSAPTIVGDKDRLKEVVGNLIENAMHAIASADVKRITVAVGRQGDEHVVVRVRDTGPGIPADIKDKLFQLYFTAKPEGTGLGLAMAKRIVAEHAGTIDARNLPAGGAEFRITLPITPMSQAEMVRLSD